MAMLRFMDDNMDDNRVPADQSQALPSARPITERLNFAITGSGQWSAENLFIFPENVTHPMYSLCVLYIQGVRAIHTQIDASILIYENSSKLFFLPLPLTCFISALEKVLID